MPFRWKTALVSAAALLPLAAAAAQSPPQPRHVPAAAAQRLPYDPRQLPAQRGEVQRLALMGRGEMHGLILSDGTEVKTPPYLSTQLAYAVRPGHSVTMHRLHAAALPLVQAVSITGEATGRTVIDTGPPGPGGPAGPRPAVTGDACGAPGQAEVQGRVRMALHGQQGEVNGALLEDGTVLRLPPPEAYRFATLLRPRQRIVAEGVLLVTSMGKVIEAQPMGPSREQLSVVETPPPPPGPGPGPRPPPPGARPGPP